MATAKTQIFNPAITNPKPMRVCFSFAAYAKNLIEHFKTCNIPVLEGLTDAEFSSIESSFGFIFPPDLRSILREGLPVGPGFPNWRSSSHQQLEILTNLPLLGICKEVISKRNFWCESWGDKPSDPDEALATAKRVLKKAPVLVPIYKHCYISSSPSLAGNPVFYVHGCDFKLSSYDVVGFFQKVEFWAPRENISLGNAPAWAATSARRVEFWSEMVEMGRGETRGWWRGELRTCLEEVFWRLRDGGWKEEEVREMMMMDGGDEKEGKREMVVIRGTEGVVWHVRRVLSLKLLRGGWSTEDVMYSLGFQWENSLPKEESLLDFQYPKSVMLKGGFEMS